MDARWTLRRGFTLIELLVVISIIALLVAMLIPALTMAREIVRYNVCKANMKNTSTAWHGFAAIHDNRFPGFAFERFSLGIFRAFRLFAELNIRPEAADFNINTFSGGEINAQRFFRCSRMFDQFQCLRDGQFMRRDVIWYP